MNEFDILVHRNHFLTGRGLTWFLEWEFIKNFNKSLSLDWLLPVIYKHMSKKFYIIFRTVFKGKDIYQRCESQES